MPPKGRHRKPHAGPPRQSGAPDITGKRASQAKNERYSRPLPVALVHANQGKRKSAQTWGQWLVSWLPTSFDQEESGHDAPLVGYWDPTTASVWVQVTPDGMTRAGKQDGSSRIASQTLTCRALWDSGFFGKGSLSRSEPTWRTRKINEEKVKLQREHGMRGKSASLRAKIQANSTKADNWAIRLLQLSRLRS